MNVKRAMRSGINEIVNPHCAKMKGFNWGQSSSGGKSVQIIVILMLIFLMGSTVPINSHIPSPTFPGIVSQSPSQYSRIKNGFGSESSANPASIPINGGILKLNETSIIKVGKWPDSLAYDPINNMVYVTNFQSNNTSVINASDNKVVATISGEDGPNAILFDPNNTYVYIADLNSNSISVVNTTSEKIISNISVGSFPSAIAYDGWNHAVYVANFMSNNLSEINTTTDKVINYISVGSQPGAIAFDNYSGLLYVANFGSNNVSLINQTTGEVQGSINVGLSPGAIAYDALAGKMFVANLGSGNISVINTSNNKIEASINNSGVPSAITYDYSNGYLYIADFNSSLVTVVDGSNDSIVTSASIAKGPNGLCFDPRSGNIYVSSGWASTVTVISTEIGYQVSFVEDGLKGIVLWTVTFNGNTESSWSNEIIFNVVNGIYNFSVLPIQGYKLTQSNGKVLVNGSSVNDTIIFRNDTYSVTFLPVNLPDGGPMEYEWQWQVTIFNGSTNSTYNSSFYSYPNGWTYACSFWEYNGTYTFTVSSINGYTPDPSSGSFIVSGDAINISINFIHPQGHLVSFNEKGMNGLGSEFWMVTVGNLTEAPGFNNFSTINFYLKNGTYTYNATVYYYYIQFTAFPPSAEFIVRGDMNITVIFKQYWSVTFAESGLPSGHRWNAWIDNLSGSSNSTTLTIKDYFAYDSNFQYFTQTEGYLGIETGNGFSNLFGYVNITIWIEFIKSYVVTFKEIGLPNGTEWGLELTNNNNTYFSDNSSIGIQATGGKWYFTVSPVNGYVVIPTEGSFYLDQNMTEIIRFEKQVKVEFVEKGLPSGKNWSVHMDGQNVSSSKSTLFVIVPSGVYNYSITLPPGYSSSKQKGELNVTPVSMITEIITIYKINKPNSSLLEYAVVAILGVIVVAVVVAYILRNRRRK